MRKRVKMLARYQRCCNPTPYAWLGFDGTMEDASLARKICCMQDKTVKMNRPDVSANLIFTASWKTNRHSDATGLRF